MRQGTLWILKPSTSSHTVECQKMHEAILKGAALWIVQTRAEQHLYARTWMLCLCMKGWTFNLHRCPWSIHTVGYLWISYSEHLQKNVSSGNLSSCGCGHMHSVTLLQDLPLSCEHSANVDLSNILHHCHILHCEAHHTAEGGSEGRR